MSFDSSFVVEQNHWTTSNGCVFPPSGAPTCSSSTATSQSLPSTSDDSQSIPTTTSLLSSLIPSSDSTVLSGSTPSSSIFSGTNTGSLSSDFATGPSSTFASTSSITQDFSTSTPSSVPISQNAVCAGEGLDASADGILASLIIPSALGLLVWLLFAILRPHFRQVYASREWFPPQDARPKPLSSSFWAFLFPPVPLIPSVSDDVSDAGSSAEKDAEIFPSDEQLTQRTLFIAFRIVLAWSILGLAGALPIYLVNLPCEADYDQQITFGGASSMMQDFSLHRLLKLFGSDTAPSTNLAVIPRTLLPRAPEDDPYNGRARIIALTALAALVILFPAMFTIIREFNRLVAYRKAWVETKCANLEMGWLSMSHAPGFKGQGEKELKDHLMQIGIAGSMNIGNTSRATSVSRERKRRKSEPSEQESPSPRHPEETSVVDIHSLYTIGSTERLSGLIDERDEILENLEVAEARYIASFRITTPEPSIADPLDREPENSGRAYISRPQRLGSFHSRKNRLGNPALASSSRAPAGFVGPSQLYKLRPVRGVTGGFFTGSQPSFSESLSIRLGGRSQEPNREGITQDTAPLASGDEAGAASSQDLLVPDPRRFGPNAIPEEDENGDEPGWIDVSEATAHGPIGTSMNGAPSRRWRDSFPLRRNDNTNNPDTLPPHLRVQRSQPFVRPDDGIDFEHLGAVYSDITYWRSRLKAINQEIGEMQKEGYTSIAEGTDIKGWIMIGTGLRFLPGIKLIEGRAKEDVRWDVLQHQHTLLNTIGYFVMCILVSILLAAGLAAAAGLALANAPEVAHYLPFLQDLWETSPIVTGLATVFAPAVAATLFIALALYVVAWAVKSCGIVSVSGSQMLLFRTTFWILTVVAAIWLTVVGALIFAVHPFGTDENGQNQAEQVASGSIYMTILALAIVLNVAILFPGLLLLQPKRLWHVWRREKHAITPRQRFRAVYPRSYNPSYAIAPCILAIVFAAAFCLIFPLIGPAITLLILLCLIAHRFLIGYVYGRTHSQTGGLLSIYITRRLGTVVGFQPILMGLIFLSRHFWITGGVLIGAGVFVIIFMEAYAYHKTRLPGFSSLTPESKEAVKAFRNSAQRPANSSSDSKSSSSGSTPRQPPTRGSMASVLEMMSITLAVMPSRSPNKGPLPLPTETIDDLTATERAARTNPNAPPRLPPLSWTREDFSRLLYAPELLADDPKIWLPNDSAGVARSEALDLQRYHQLEVILDVEAMPDASPNLRRSTSTR